MADENRLLAEGPYHPIRGMNLDSNGIAADALECIDVQNCRITQSEVRARAGSRELDSAANPTEDIIEYHRYVDPESGSRAFAFCANSIWRYVSAAVGWVDVSNSLLTNKNFTQWSVTSTISETVGATVVAAGSLYTRPNDAQSGGGARALLYYDRDALPYGEFKELDITTYFPITEEDTTVNGPAVAGAVVGPELGASDSLNPNYDANFTGYKAGTVVLSTVQSGIIARSGEVEYTIGGELCYRLIPTNTTNINYGDTSYVRKDGDHWQLDFLSGTHQDERIFVAYEYGADFKTYPTYVAYFHNTLIMANTFEDATYQPWRLRWAEPGDIFTAKAGSYVDVVVGDITPILDLRVVETVASSLLSSFLYIYKQNNIVRAEFNRAYNADPDLPVPFLSLDVAYSEGIETVRTLQVINGQQIYLGRNDIYSFNGGERFSLTLNRDTGASRIREYIFTNLDRDNLNLCFSVYDEIQKQYILFVKFLSDTTKYPVNAFALDLERGTWTRHLLPECSAALAADITPRASIDSLVGEIQQLEGAIEDLAGNSSKLVLLAMTTRSYILGLGAYDRTRDDGLLVKFDAADPNPKRLYPTDNIINGKPTWVLDSGGTGATMSANWTGTQWLLASGALYESTHPTATGEKPPEEGWDPWEELGVPTQDTPSLTYFEVGEDFDSFFLTRDFVGGTIQNQDRTQLLYVEGRKGSIEVSYNADYSLTLADYSIINEQVFGAKYVRKTFAPDVTANNIRFLVRIKDGAIFRWMQTFSIRQDMTNL